MNREGACQLADHGEERLAGGNVSNVYRAGNTVRREWKPESGRIHKLLLHLEKKKYPYAPRFLGVDDQGREVLSYIEGEAGHYPLKGYMGSDEVLTEIAGMLRRYHDAVCDFPIPEEWPSLDRTPAPREVICHNDFAMYNIIFHNEHPAGVIDFDVAAPGPRMWDIAYTLYTCVPLSRKHDDADGNAVPYRFPEDAERIKRRVKLFFAGYGMEEEGYLEMVELRLEGLTALMTRKAAEGDAAFQKMIEEGHLEHYQKDIAFLCKHGKEWM